ncbi:BID domain-containing T4SS effector [Bartonella henselae]|uniref:BID domain-containing T4SS effector n=1 Tax=Bartonella henselae TaxID=38323 RepID=UPI0003DFA288|nr:BID domain-containing T4SS effector [Bartonella henselae]ETS06079.1 hypothetical protein Q653_01527 [Bartonella henselae JK 42]ETS11099.1 hypothetical protein Q652_01500 [Bartonella henselae JK 41]KEC56222.1 hypothetical protein O97_01429 [Bartonella henselae str. Zeus]KEC58910.1 hypothetical protein O95_01476 [Bartonella henselae JK 53]MDM9983347.1 BID domain-containing T4SS effector [Bartonella henselae]
MKRNQPQPPTTHSTEKQREPYGQSAARAPSPEPLYAKVNKKPPRAKDRELNKPLTQQEEVVYAALDFENRSHHPRERYPERNLESETLYTTVASQSTTKAEILYADVIHTPLHSKHMRKEQTSETLYTTVAPRRTTSSLTREEIADRIQHNPLVQAYQQEVTHWCQIVYGNSDVLNEKMQEVLQKPSKGEDLSRQVAEHPTSVHKLAGRNLCGLKTNARRQAEEGFMHLCQALDGYASAVKQAQENITHVPRAEARRYGQESEQRAERLQQSRHPERERQSLSNQELLGMVQENASIQRYQAQVERWCQIVYGNSSVLKEKMEDILQNPSEGEELSWQVAAYPQSVHKFAGVNVCGLKTSARRHAESGLSHLCDAVDNYANAVQQVKESITRSHQAQTRQNRQEQSVGVKQGLHKEKALSRPFQQPERQACHEGAKTSRQIYQQRPEIPPRKVGAAKAMAFAS